jgi:type VI secretion system protein ImpL
MTLGLNNVVLLMGTLVVLAGIAAVVIAWVRKGKAAKAAKGGAGTAPPAKDAGKEQAIRALFREAATRLKLAPRMAGAKLSSLPLILILGPEKSGKTSVVTRSGLDPELLAGQVYQDTETVPTENLNIWLARQTLLVELAAPLAADPAALALVLKHLTPGRIGAAFRRSRPARSILFCFPQAPAAGATTNEEIAAAARPWNQSLTAIASCLGAQVPVYVLFTKLDAAPGFSNFVANLTAREPDQALGATIRPFNPAGRGAYAEETARAVNSHFSQVVYSLGESRVPLLVREQDRTEAALQYQFPRDFQRLQKNLVQFLVELAKPSQLQVTPFLRGFYFSGTRQVAVEQAPGLAQPLVREPDARETMIATTVFDPEQMGRQPQAIPQRAPARTNTEWLFVRSLFDGVILRDRSAQGVSTTSSRSDRARALIFGLAALVGVFLLTAFSISYVGNRQLERQLIQGAEELRSSNSGNVVDRLEKIRPGVDKLLEYRTHTPPWMRWGLYSGDAMLPAAQELYCSEIGAGTVDRPNRTKFLEGVMKRMATHLEGLGKLEDDADAGFAILKTYMMVTTNPEKAYPEMADVLFNMWRETPGAASETAAPQNLVAEFRTYLRLLPITDRRSACVNPAYGGLIESAQQHFRDLHYNDHYQSLLQQAGAGVPPIIYDEKFANPAVKDPQMVKGCFTRRGWEQMQHILSQPPESWNSTEWVLNESKPVTSEEVPGFRARYASDYKKAWLDYLSAANVPPYLNVPDASKKLQMMSDQQSKLLSLLGVASENTAVDEDLKAAFQPVRAVVPSPTDFQPAADYRSNLAILQNRLDALKPTGPEHDRSVEAITVAENAVRDSVAKLGLSFKGDAAEPVQKLLLAPLQPIEKLLNKQDADAVNGAAESLCSAYGALAKSRPFTASRHEASADEVAQVFQPERGKMWQFNKSYLGDSLDCTGDSCRPIDNPRYRTTSAFDVFFTRMVKLSRLFFSGNDPVVRLRLTVRPYNYVSRLYFTVDDSTTAIPAGSSREISWDPRNNQSFKVSGDFEGAEPNELLFGTTGPWALFDWLYGDSRPEGRTSGTFRWIPTSGGPTPQPFKNGHTKEYRVEVRSGDGLVELQSLSAGACPPAVAR